MRPRYGAPCACHGEPMAWHKMDDRPGGGVWRCAVKKRESARVSIAAKRKKEKAKKQRAAYTARRKAEMLAASREMWRQRALAAEWGLKHAHGRMTDKNEPHAGENGVKMPTHKTGGDCLADRTVAA